MRSSLALLFLLSISPGRTAMAQDRMSDEQQVRTLDNEERVAALKRDIPALERLWSDHLSVNAPNNQVVAGRHAVLDAGLVAGQTIRRRFTNIWKNEDGTWRLFVRHANVIPSR
jgi:hypothetical protein